MSVVSIEMMTDAGRGEDGTEWCCVKGEQKGAEDRALWDAAGKRTAGRFGIGTRRNEGTVGEVRAEPG